MLSKEWLWEIRKIYKDSYVPFLVCLLKDFHHLLKTHEESWQTKAKVPFWLLWFRRFFLSSKSSGLWEQEGKIHEYLRGSTQFSFPAAAKITFSGKSGQNLRRNSLNALSYFALGFIDQFDFLNSKLIILMSVLFAIKDKHNWRLLLLHEFIEFYDRKFQFFSKILALEIRSKVE